MYNWARLESAAGPKATALGIVEQKMWPGFASHKNSFFTFLSAANMKSPDSAQLAMANEQLAQFPVPPLVRRPIDLRGDPRFSAREPSCNDEKASHATPIDVKERVYDGFIWQRDPWTLYDGGDLARVLPGVDYLAPYFLGLRHGFIKDDAESRCTRRQ
jgi:hypothetical protein